MRMQKYCMRKFIDFVHNRFAFKRFLTSIKLICIRPILSQRWMLIAFMNNSFIITTPPSSTAFTKSTEEEEPRLLDCSALPSMV